MPHPLRLLGGAILAACALVALPTRAAAQRPTPAEQEERRRAEVRAQLVAADSLATLAVETRDGSTFVGRVVAVEGDRVRFATAAGNVTFDLAAVTRVRTIAPGDVRDGAYWFPNPNATRLLFGPTGRMLPRGDGYISDYQLFLPGFAVGVTDRVSVGGGVSLVPGVDFGEQLFYFTPKVGIVSGPTTNVAVGALIGAVPAFGDGDGESFGVVYAVGTHGSPNGSVTLGLGVGYAGGDLADSPAVMLGGERRLSRRVGLVTENYFFSGVSDQPLVSLAVRFMGEQIAVDLGLVNVLGEDAIYPGVPFVGVVFNF